MNTLWRKRLFMVVIDGLAGMGAAGISHATGLSQGVTAIAALLAVIIASASLNEPVRAHAFLALCFACLGLAVVRL